MDEQRIEELLRKVQNGSCPVSDAVQILKRMPAEEMEFACLDHHRHLRTGFPEVVYGENKTAAQLIAILDKMLQGRGVVMATRVNADKAEAVQEKLNGLHYHETARMLSGNTEQVAGNNDRGFILVISAGTSDIPVAEEAALTAAFLGNPVERLYDVGVAGIHRLLNKKELLFNAEVLIVVAGMEGALPSVVGGLVDKPVIAVPTSIGYGTGLGGFAALLGMLNSCAPGVAVVNIDNGFGAGCMAAAINRH